MGLNPPSKHEGYRFSYKLLSWSHVWIWIILFLTLFVDQHFVKMKYVHFKLNYKEQLVGSVLFEYKLTVFYNKKRDICANQANTKPYWHEAFQCNKAQHLSYWLNKNSNATGTNPDQGFKSVYQNPHFCRKCLNNCIYKWEEPFCSFREHSLVWQSSSLSLWNWDCAEH